VLATPRFLQGIYPFEGKGLDEPFLLDGMLSYVVPDGVITQPVYFRGGNTTEDMICVLLMRDGSPMRYFPIGAKADVHVPLRVVEDLASGSTIQLYLAAPVGSAGSVVVDLGLAEV
jgi:hypothetical protein